MTTLLIVLGVLAAYMTLLFVVSLALRNNGVADVGYGGAFIVVITAAAFLMPPTSTGILGLMLLPFVWGTRLVLRIYHKNLGKPEDFRYKAWRDAWGSNFMLRSFLQVYMLQGLVVFVVSLPVLLSIVFPSLIHKELAFVGGCIWLVGFFFEAVGDYQLDRFIANPANKDQIMMSGLWHYTRHPNYFGESCMWWGIAIASAGMNTVPVLGFVSPILITFRLLKVSGVPLLEARWAGNPVWEEYKKKTSLFIPMRSAR